MSGVTPPLTPLRWFLDKLRSERVLKRTHLIAPPTSWPRFLATIHRAKYFPLAPLGASDMMLPASATLGG